MRVLSACLFFLVYLRELIIEFAILTLLHPNHHGRTDKQPSEEFVLVCRLTGSGSILNFILIDSDTCKIYSNSPNH